MGRGHVNIVETLAKELVGEEADLANTIARQLIESLDVRTIIYSATNIPDMSAQSMRSITLDSSGTPRLRRAEDTHRFGPSGVAVSVLVSTLDDLRAANMRITFDQRSPRGLTAQQRYEVLERLLEIIAQEAAKARIEAGNP